MPEPAAQPPLELAPREEIAKALTGLLNSIRVISTNLDPGTGPADAATDEQRLGRAAKNIQFAVVLLRNSLSKTADVRAAQTALQYVNQNLNQATHYLGDAAEAQGDIGKTKKDLEAVVNSIRQAGKHTNAYLQGQDAGNAVDKLPKSVQLSLLAALRAAGKAQERVCRTDLADGSIRGEPARKTPLKLREAGRLIEYAKGFWPTIIPGLIRDLNLSSADQPHQRNALADIAERLLAGVPAVFEQAINQYETAGESPDDRIEARKIMGSAYSDLRLAQKALKGLELDEGSSPILTETHQQLSVLCSDMCTVRDAFIDTIGTRGWGRIEESGEDQIKLAQALEEFSRGLKALMEKALRGR